MATCSAQTLMADGPCFCAVTSDPFVLARLALLCDILQTLSPMASCDVGQLLEDGRCFCPVTVDPAEIVELQLLCEIKAASTGGGGGGGTNNQSGVGSPVGVKTPAYVGQGYTDTVAPYHQWFATGLTSADWFGIV